MKTIISFLIVIILLSLAILIITVVSTNIFWNKYNNRLIQEMDMTLHLRYIENLFNDETVSIKRIKEEIDFFTIKWKNTNSASYAEYVEILNNNFKQLI